MPISPYSGQIEPKSSSVIWRFMPMDIFRDLMASEELYFRRVDTFKDKDPFEGLPADGYVRRIFNLAKYDVLDELTLNDHQAQNRQFSEGSFITCWHLFERETLKMWRQYGQGVAICSRYELLKAALDGMLDPTYLGQVRYGDEEMTGYNQLHFLFTKGSGFVHEREVRALLTSYNPVGSTNRHFTCYNFPSREPLDDVNPLHPWVKNHKRRRIDLKKLVEGVVVSPWATQEQFDEVKLWVKLKNFTCSVSRSDQTGNLTPTPEELHKLGL